MIHKFKYLINNKKYNMQYIILLHCLKKTPNTYRNTKRYFLLLKNTNKPHIKN